MTREEQGFEGDGSVASKLRTALLVVAMMLAALGVRLATLDFALPIQQEPDPHILGQVETFSQESVSERDVFFSSIYPHLLMRASLLAGAKPVVGAAPDATLDEHLAAASSLHLRVREVIAWFSVLLIPATFWLCRQFQSRNAALFAAALAATSLLNLQFGQQARPHAAIAPLIALSVAAAVHLRRRPSFGSFTLLGALLGLTIGCLTNGAAAFLSAGPAYFLRERVQGWRRFFDPLALLPIALVALAVYVFWPFLFVPTPPDAVASSGAAEGATPSSGPLFRVLAAGALAGLGVLGVVVAWLREQPSPRLRWASLALLAAGLALFYALRETTVFLGWQTIEMSDFAGKGFPTFFMTAWYYEPVALVLFVVGLIAWIVRPRCDAALERTRAKDLLVVLSFALVYAIVIGLHRRCQQRFLLPLLPFLFCGAAYGMTHLLAGLRRVASAKAARPTVWIVTALVLATPTLATLGYTRMRLRPMTLEQATAWLHENVDPDHSKVACHLLYDLPVVRRESNLFDEQGAPGPIFSPWQRYQQDWIAKTWRGERWNVEMLYPDRRRWPWIVKNPDAYLDELAADYVICPGEVGVGFNPMMSAVRDALRKRGEPLATFPLESRPKPSGLEGLDTPHFTYFVWTRHWFGPEIEIYRGGRALEGR